MDATTGSPVSQRSLGTEFFGSGHYGPKRSRSIVRIAQSVLLTMALTSSGCSDAIDNPSATIEARFPSPASSTNSHSRSPFAHAQPQANTQRYEPKVPADSTVQTLAFPTGDIESSVVLLHQVSPRIADLSQPFMLEYHVTNLTDATLDEVRVHLHQVENLTLLDSSVHPQLTQDTLFWSLGRLGPGQTRVVRVTARANSTGPAQTLATVTYQNVLRSQTAIVEPVLRIEKTAPAFAARDDIFEMQYTLTNTGTGTARRVRIVDELPLGVRTLDNKQRIIFPVLAIGPGQTEHRTVRVRAKHTGLFASHATLTAEPEIHASSGAPEIEVLDPVLMLDAALLQPAIRNEEEKSAPAKYLLTLHNIGKVPARAIRLTASLGKAHLLSTSVPAIRRTDSVILGCDLLKPGGTIVFEITLQLRTGQAQSLKAIAAADHADPVLAPSVALRTQTPERTAPASVGHTEMAMAERVSEHPQR